jgi:hypothetical protein
MDCDAGEELSLLEGLLVLEYLSLENEPDVLDLEP